MHGQTATPESLAMFGNPATASAVTFCFTHTQSRADGLQQKIKRNSRSSGGTPFIYQSPNRRKTHLAGANRGEHVWRTASGGALSTEDCGRFYTKGEYAAAAAEYEKFITLYETSAGAPYAQLMWSHCQVKLRKVYTGIRDGFQSVIDYWPESTEAMLASYLISQSYKSIGELKKAEIAYGKAVNSHPEKHIAVLSKWDIAEIAKIQKNEKRLIQV